MSSRSELARNNIRTGVFVSAAMLLALATIVAVSDLKERLFEQYEEYLVRYPIASGVGALGEGSEVRLGGMKMGAVLGVVPETGGEKLDHLLVTFELSDRVTLRQMPKVTVNASLIGSESWIDIHDVGSGDAHERHVPIEGYTGPPVLTGILGHEGAEDADRFLEFLGSVEDKYQADMKPAIDNVDALTSDAREMIADVRENHWDDWVARVDRVTGWADGFTGELDGAMADSRKFIGTLQDTVDENRPNVKDSIANVREVTEHVKTVTVAKVDDLLDRGRTALADTEKLVGTVRRDYDQWAVELGHTLANASLASQQLKLATIEVRRNPWKILYRPQQTELEHELLYEAARSFAIAAADLRATGDAIERVVDRYGPELSESQPAFNRLRENLDRSLERYTEAQQELLTVLKSEVGE